MDDYLESGRIKTNLELLSQKPQRKFGGGGLQSNIPSSVTRKEDLFLTGYGRQWGEKLTYSTGLAYGSGVLLGGGFGLIQGFRKGGATPKLFVNSVLNSCAVHGPSLANQFAAITMFYCGFNNLIGLIRAGDNDSLNATLAGSLAGAIYKIAGGGWRTVGKYSLASGVLFTGVDFAFKKGYI